MLSLNAQQFDRFQQELNRITPLIHPSDRRNNFIIVNPELQQLMLTPTFHMILSEIVPMLRSIDPVSIERTGPVLAEKGWTFLFGDQQYYVHMLNQGA